MNFPLMKKMLQCVLCLMIFYSLSACATTNPESTYSPPGAKFEHSGVKIKVSDVSNKTGELFDVDVIGLMWNALDVSLHRRALLWDPASGGTPMEVRAEIVEYQKGSIFLRNILPPWGKTSIRAKLHLVDQGRVVASSETEQTISVGNGPFTTEAWRKIFLQAAEDLINKIVRNL